MVTYKILVSGRVQGVYFRFSTKKKALELNLKGTVENTKEGDVLIFVEGENPEMEFFSKWCRHGPLLANVTNIKIEEIPYFGFVGFEILTSR